MVAPFAGDADAVIGSRMMDRGAPARRHAPVQDVGNRILTIQNAAGGTELTEWHSGYRAYASAARGIPFEGDTDGFDFDTEILVQLRPGPHRRGAHPHLLRRRDLPRQRHPLRLDVSATSPATGWPRWVSAETESGTSSRPVRDQTRSARLSTSISLAGWPTAPRPCARSRLR